MNAEVPAWAGSSNASVSLTAGTIGEAVDVQAWAALAGKGISGTGITTDYLCQSRSPDTPTRGAFEK